MVGAWSLLWRRGGLAGWLGGGARELIWFLLLSLGLAAQGIDRCPRRNTCANLNCYDNNQQCNGKDDCGDNSDEWDCDVLDQFNNATSKTFVWPWWILGLTCAVVVGTCLAIVCRYIRERTDPSLDAYLLEQPTPSRSRTRSRDRSRSHERSRPQERPSGIEMSRKSSDRCKNPPPPASAERGRPGRSGDSYRERPKPKQLPPPIPPPPRVSPGEAAGGAASDQHTVDIEPLPPPPTHQPTRVAPPVPSQQPAPPAVAPKPKQRTSSGSGSESAPGSPQPPTAWQNATSAQISSRGGGSGNRPSGATPPPSYEEVHVEGYRTLQVDQRSAMARGEETPNNK